MTAEDLFNLPPDNLRHGLIRGELTTMPPTGGEHGVRAFKIALQFGKFLGAHPIGVGLGAGTGFRVAHDPDTVLAPDCAFVRADRIPPVKDRKKFWPLAPDLAVEVLSPSDLASEVLEKIDEWLEAGTRLVWVIDPEKKRVTVYAPGRQPRTLRAADTLSGEDVLPGLELAVADIFK
jgi:Uma2 family endonuclease